MRSTVLVFSGLVLCSSVAFGDPLDKPAFTATPAELLAATKQLPASAANDDVTILRIDDELRFDEHSRVTERWRLVAVIRTKAGADDWDSIGYGYRPSYQDRPQVRVRVIDPGSTVAELDPRQAREDPSRKYADRLEGTVPLPRIVVGAVIEEQVVIADREPMSAAGASSSTTVARSLATRLSVVAPTTLKVRAVLHGFATARPLHTTSDGLETWRYTLGPTKPPARERNMPADSDDSPLLTATSFASWGALAKELHARVDAQIAAGPITLPPELPHAATDTGPRAILTWLQKHVEPNHVVVTDAAIVPKSPAETLKLGRADDLAMAVAYVALLRQGGIPADVALIDIGPGPDVRPDLPMLDQLDHALVRAHVEGRDLWIDPTVDALGIATLPPTERRRHALVLAAATSALVDTPPLATPDYLQRDTRTYELADAGRARITELRRFGKVWEVYARIAQRDDPKGLEKDITDDAKSHFAVDRVDRLTTTDPAAPELPFEVTSIMTSPRGYTSRREAQVWLFSSDITSTLPDALVKEDEPTRVYDFEWTAPQVYEIEHRIVVPDGYAMPAIADRVRDLGTMKLTETQRIAGNVLTVTLRLETGKLRITPAELTATRKAIKGLADEKIHIVFPNVAHQLYDKGGWKDAVAESMRVIHAHPRDGKRHAALAELLVLMGQGEAGRREARVAVQLEPNEADNHVMLGWALAHDLFGRPYGPGHDHAGARAELEKARKLDPNHVGAAVELGNLLARDERGHVWERGADPKACAIARRAANELEPTPAHAEDLARALLWARDYAGVEKVARTAEQSDNRDALLIAAVVLESGVPAAVHVADGLGSSDTRKRALTTAAATLLAVRHYAEARAVYAELGIFGPTTAQGHMFEKLSVVDHPLDIKTPVGAMIEAELSVMRDQKPQGFWDVKTEAEVSREIERTMRAASKTAWLSGEVYGDIARSMPTGKVEGDKRAWRVELGFGGQTEVIYAAEDRGTIKLIGVPAASYGLGRHALRLLANNDVEAARRLLDWVAKDAKHPTLFEVVWGPNHATDRDAVELAAAVLSGPTDPDHALAIVKKCTAAPPKADLACVATMDEINTARGALDDTIGEVTARLATHPKEALSSRVLAEAFARSGRAREAEALLPDITAPFDRDLDRVRVAIALAENDTPAAIKILEAATKVAGAPSYPFNELAWLEVTTPTRLPDAVAAATEAVRLDANVATLHTKAVVDEEVGDFPSALEDDRKAIELRNRNEPDDNDWYVLGRIAELIGLRDDAISAYRRLKAPRIANRFIVGSYTLAQRRLAALGKP